MATSYNCLVTAHSDLGDITQAKTNYARALEIRLKRPEPEHVHVATSYNNLGTVYTDLGDFQQEKHNYARALVIYLKQLGPYHIDVVASSIT